jgi:hypothetical protein
MAINICVKFGVKFIATHRCPLLHGGEFIVSNSPQQHLQTPVVQFPCKETAPDLGVALFVLDIQPPEE